MKFYSPLRYPGGKNKLAKFVALVCQKNNINGHYVEPYAGGASVALYLLMHKYVKEITINDLDLGIYAFWHSILNGTEEFCRKIKDTKITVNNWKKYKKIHSNYTNTGLFNLGFATFFLNRTNRSGIIDGGIIGGLEQKGKYKINCRFNKEDLIGRIRLISKYKKNIHLRHLDALKLIKNLQEQTDNKNAIFYFDPPYYMRGPSLYMNSYCDRDHERVSKKIQKIKNASWIVTYDNVKATQILYRSYKKKEYSLLYTAYEKRKGREVMFFSNNLTIPRIQNPVMV